MELETIIKLVVNNGLAMVLLIWFLYKADKYISVFIPKLDKILDQLTRQTIAFSRMSDEIKKWNGEK